MKNAFKTIRLLVLLLILQLLLGACGQRGPLYLKEDSAATADAGQNTDQNTGQAQDPADGNVSGDLAEERDDG